MACCSTQTECNCCFNAGGFDPCNNLVLEETASETGSHVLKVDYLGQSVSVTAEQTAGQPLTFPLSGLNESFSFSGVIYAPAQDVVRVFGKQSIKFKTQKQYQL